MTKLLTHQIRFRVTEDEQVLIDRILAQNPHLANVSELMRWMIAMYASMERNDDED